ncbi:MAG: DUF1992 domain-containing protein [Proteobacteria bacterium]|nr:DUF1992 domain-containing protein [Pseudomonadota bacterium]MBU1420026.1 DUF1992 domain-containing protein [Pseudomonadota bacterium]MBU1453085.1 DUF1992 domain-containing protein [Pseudomonadota bacterium]
MFTAIQQIAERRIEEAMKSGRGPDLSHWKNKPLPLDDDMANVPPHLRIAYKILRNAGYVPEEVALQKEISRLEDLLDGCTDEKIKIEQMKKLDFLRFKLDTKMGKKLHFDSDSPYYSKVVDRISPKAR